MVTDFPAGFALIADDGFFNVVQDRLVIQETANDGAASLVCSLPPGLRALQFDTTRTNFPARFRFLREMVSCDGAVLLERQPGVWEAHVFECKRTMGTDKWAHAKKQMGWSLVRLHALASVVGITISAAFCHTAFRETRLHLVRETPDPALLRAPLGGLPESHTDTSILLGPNLDWDDESPELPPLFQRVRHIPHRLDPTDGSGQCTL